MSGHRERRLRALADDWATISGDNVTAVEVWHAAADELIAALELGATAEAPGSEAACVICRRAERAVTPPAARDLVAAVAESLP